VRAGEEGGPRHAGLRGGNIRAAGIDFRRSDQLLGFVWGKWTKEGGEQLALLEKGEWPRFASGDPKWKSKEAYGGTKNDFDIGENITGNVPPRLLRWRAKQADRDQLLVPANNPGLGVRMARLKIFKSSQISGLEWNDSEMKAAWNIPVDAYLGDFAIAEMLGESRPQLWSIVTGPNDRTVLISYSLP